ncbi:hypothetical protein CDL12_23266 [Handroanthus impetiginosus]|uniref:Uncharacterized protein n=1 Tax=Handroanthus impetiginosus TaxID=429701 RepID=A0A2G9GFZ0_9LAMI|nr:hypothetical protein CDL12_23266 [Handroanthus impetiginosus]
MRSFGKLQNALLRLEVLYLPRFFNLNLRASISQQIKQEISTPVMVEISINFPALPCFFFLNTSPSIKIFYRTSYSSYHISISRTIHVGSAFCRCYQVLS